MRVLTVDDSRTILAMLHHTLSNAGFEVLQAEDGQKGLDVLATENVDVVITDINMPVMDGIEFIKQVRASGEHNSLPILILAACFVVLAATGLLVARWIARPIERLSRTASAIGSGDLTARSRLDRSDEIGELGHQLDEMADRLARLIATERELLANVAHELRTPLSRIGVALDLAGEGDADAARAALAEISVDVGELETITDDILTAIAEGGGGRYTFVIDPKLAEASFIRALGAQLDVVAERVELLLAPGPGVEIVRILEDPPTAFGAGGLRVTLSDLVVGDELNIVAELRVRAPREPGPIRALTATLSCNLAGTARAFQVSEEAGTFAGIAMGLNGALTALVFALLALAL